MSAATVAKPAAKPSTYLSGHCGVAAHDRCRGTYAGTPCTCTCHLACRTCGQALPTTTRSTR